MVKYWNKTEYQSSNNLFRSEYDQIMSFLLLFIFFFLLLSILVLCSFFFAWLVDQCHFFCFDSLFPNFISFHHTFLSSLFSFIHLSLFSFSFHTNFSLCIISSIYIVKYEIISNNIVNINTISSFLPIILSFVS